MVVQRFDVFLASLDPTVGSEIQKTRPCVVISSDELNQHLATVIVAPMTTGGQRYSSRVPCHFQGKDGYVALDHIRSIDRRRLVKALGRLDTATQKAVLQGRADMFAE